MAEGIIDAHHHLWRRERHPQPWIDPVSMAAIDADFEPTDLAVETKPSGVTGTVGVLVAFPNAAGQRQETPGPGQSQAAAEAGQLTAERTEDDTTARSEPADPSLALDCKDFTSQEAAQKALDQGVEDPEVIERETGLEVLNLPTLEEYFVEFNFRFPED